MLLAGVDVQTLQGILGDDVAGHHAADGHAHSQLGLVLHQDAVLGLLQTAHPTGVGTIVLLLLLVAGQDSFAGVDDDDVVTAVGVVCVGNLGLAAQQVSVLRRIAVVDVEDGYKYELVTPVIVESEGSQIGQEGCLSIPGYNCNVKRPFRVKVTAFDRFGNEQTYDVQGFPAVAVCHEIDHLDGILFKDNKTDEPADR